CERLVAVEPALVPPRGGGPGGATGDPEQGDANLGSGGADRLERAAGAGGDSKGQGEEQDGLGHGRLRSWSKVNAVRRSPVLLPAPSPAPGPAPHWPTTVGGSAPSRQTWEVACGGRREDAATTSRIAETRPAAVGSAGCAGSGWAASSSCWC